MSMSYQEEIAARLPLNETLCKLAEECAELAQAALKYKRALEGVNPTPVTPEAAEVRLIEENGDVYLAVDILARHIGIDKVVNDATTVMAYKEKRWAGRLRAAEAPCGPDACDLDRGDGPEYEPPRMG